MYKEKKALNISCFLPFHYFLNYPFSLLLKNLGKETGFVRLCEEKSSRVPDENPGFISHFSPAQIHYYSYILQRKIEQLCYLCSR